MFHPRYELKYWVTEGQACAIASGILPYMRPDNHARAGRYEIASLYLDSRDLRLCRESLHGIKNRFKLRVRRYSDAPGSPYFFEIKRRINRVIAKSRVEVASEAVMPLLAREQRSFAVGQPSNKVLSQFDYYRRAIGAAPLIWVRYLRHAFVSRNGDGVRVTFDRNLSFKPFVTPSADVRAWRRVPQNGVILEIKFNRSYPAWISRLVQQHELDLQSISKYTHTVGRAGEMHLLTPVGGWELSSGTMPAEHNFASPSRNALAS